MKKILFVLTLGCIGNIVSAQEVKDPKGNIIAYITRGIIMDKNKNVLCTFMSDGRIVDQQANTLGFIDNYGEFTDKEHKVVGRWIGDDGTVRNGSSQVIGSIVNSIGPVLKNGIVVATIDNVEPNWAAVYFFMLKP